MVDKLFPGFSSGKKNPPSFNLWVPVTVMVRNLVFTLKKTQRNALWTLESHSYLPMKDCGSKTPASKQKVVHYVSLWHSGLG